MTKATETTGERRDVTCGPALSHRRLFASLRAHDRPRALGAPSPTHVVVVVPPHFWRRRSCPPADHYGAGKEWRASGSPVHAVLNVSIWLKLPLKGVRYGAFGRGDLLVSEMEIELSSFTG
jgi:hypothetical protein